MSDNITNAIINNIKETIRKDLEIEYTEYKNKCLEDLDFKFEAKRNSVIKSALDGIDISIMENQPYSLEPIIQIKIEKKIILKGE